MSMYDFLGFGKTTSALAGAGVGAITTHAIHKVTTGRKAKKLEERLGGGSENDIERTIKKIAILKTLAYKDGSCSAEEKLYLHDYILQHPCLPTDIKVELLLEMNEAPPTSFLTIVKEIASSVKYDDLFLTKEEVAIYSSFKG